MSASSLHISSASVSDIMSLRNRAGVYDSQDGAKAGMPELDVRIDLQYSLPMFDSQHASFSLFHQLRVRIVGHHEPVEHPGCLVSISLCNSTLTAYSFPPHLRRLRVCSPTSEIERSNHGSAAQYASAYDVFNVGPEVSNAL